MHSNLLQHRLRNQRRVLHLRTKESSLRLDCTWSKGRIKWQFLDSTLYLDYFLEDLPLLWPVINHPHAVKKVAGIHSVDSVEEAVEPGVQVSDVQIRYPSCKQESAV